MAFNSYAALQTAVGNWLARGDLAASIPDFITLAEAEIARTLRKFTLRATLVLDSDVVALPADCAELRTIRLSDAPVGRNLPLRNATPEMLAEVRSNRAGVAGVPAYYAIVEDELLLVPTPDRSYSAEITYFEKLEPLATAMGGVNQVLLEAPDVYLFGALKEAEPYLEHDERVALWQGKFDKAIAQLENERQRAEFSSGLKPARLPRVF